jgi:hypothetical protein
MKTRPAAVSRKTAHDSLLMPTVTDLYHEMVGELAFVRPILAHVGIESRVARPASHKKTPVTGAYFDGLPRSSSRCGVIGSLSGKNQTAGLPCWRYCRSRESSTSLTVLAGPRS